MAAPFRALPPGVYFNPTAEECVRDFLKPWAAGVPPPTDRVICDVDLYSDSPGALLLGREPGFSRAFDHKWLMLSRCRGGNAAAGHGRGRRAVATGGSWQSEQTPQCVVGEEEDEQQPLGGRRRSFGFYVGANGSQGKGGKRSRGEKTPWLMEEFTASEDGSGGGAADGTFPVFCKIYLTPRLEKEDYDKKRQILGDDMVALDRHGKLKLVTVVVLPEVFHAFVAAPSPPPPPRVLGFRQAQPARRVLGHQQGQPPSPAPAPRVLGHQQVRPGPLPPPPLRFLGHQHGQAAATPAVLGHDHGRAMLPRGAPAHRDGQALLPWGVPAHHHGHAAFAATPHQGFLDYPQVHAAVQGGISVLHVLDPCYSQEALPTVVAGGHYNNLPPERLVDPQQGEAMAHMEKKKPRLAYGSPAPSDSDTSCLVQVHDDNQCSAEPVVTTLPPQELAEDAGKVGAEPILDLGICVNLVDFEPFSDALPDFLVNGEFKPPYDDDEPPPPPGFDEFPWADFITGVAFNDLGK